MTIKKKKKIQAPINEYASKFKLKIKLGPRKKKPATGSAKKTPSESQQPGTPSSGKRKKPALKPTRLSSQLDVLGEATSSGEPMINGVAKSGAKRPTKRPQQLKPSADDSKVTMNPVVVLHRIDVNHQNSQSSQNGNTDPPSDDMSDLRLPEETQEEPKLVDKAKHQPEPQGDKSELAGTAVVSTTSSAGSKGRKTLKGKKPQQNKKKTQMTNNQKSEGVEPNSAKGQFVCKMDGCDKVFKNAKDRLEHMILDMQICKIDLPRREVEKRPEFPAR